MDSSHFRQVALGWVGAAVAAAVAVSVAVSGLHFVAPVLLFGAPTDVIINSGVIIVSVSIAVGLTVVGVRMWADRRQD
jgi:hypothetical protein